MLIEEKRKAFQDHCGRHNYIREDENTFYNRYDETLKVEFDESISEIIASMYVDKSTSSERVAYRWHFIEEDQRLTFLIAYAWRRKEFIIRLPSKDDHPYISKILNQRQEEVKAFLVAVFSKKEYRLKLATKEVDIIPDYEYQLEINRALNQIGVIN